MSVINELEEGESLEVKLIRLAEYEIRRRLARYQLTDHIFREKYGMSLGEFEAAETIKKLDSSFKVESDHQEWDLAVDGIQTMQRRLDELQSSP
jgi:hypothetical protein